MKQSHTKQHTSSSSNSPNAAAETFVLAGVVVLEHDLQLDSLNELALLVLGALQHSIDGVVVGVTGNLTVGV